MGGGRCLLTQTLESPKIILLDRNLLRLRSRVTGSEMGNGVPRQNFLVGMGRKENTEGGGHGAHGGNAKSGELGYELHLTPPLYLAANRVGHPDSTNVSV